MLKVNGTSIYLTCGDSAKFTITATADDGTAYTFAVGDVVAFTVKKTNRKTDTTNLIRKQVTVATAATSVDITLDPADTKDLDFKKYYYDIQLTTTTGWVDTIIENSIFEVGIEIGY